MGNLTSSNLTDWLRCIINYSCSGILACPANCTRYGCNAAGAPVCDDCTCAGMYSSTGTAGIDEYRHST